MSSEDYVPDMSTLRRLAILAKYDESYTIPHGLTREERRAWVSDISKLHTPYFYNIVIESCLDWDDSEYRKNDLGKVDINRLGDVIDMLNSYWEYNGEDVLNETIIAWMLDNHRSGSMKTQYDDKLEILEDDSTVSFESCRRRFTITMSNVEQETDNYFNRDFGSNISNLIEEDLKGSTRETLKKSIIGALEKMPEIDKFDVDIEKTENGFLIHVDYSEI